MVNPEIPSESVEQLNPINTNLTVQTRYQKCNIISKNNRSLIVDVWDTKRQAPRVLKVARKNGPIQQEIEVLKQVRHPNIVRLHKIHQLDGATCLVLEKIKGVSLIDLLEAQKKLSETEASIISRQLVSAMGYLHSCGWTHRDIKPDNTMYDRETRKVKLIDFEFSYEHSVWRKQTLKRGTIEYTSPEVRKGSYIGPEIDIWSLGVTIYVMVVGEFPFSEQVLLKRKETFNKPSCISPTCSDLLSQMLDPNPRNRPNSESLKIHPWLNQGGSTSEDLIELKDFQESFNLLSLFTELTEMIA